MIIHRRCLAVLLTSFAMVGPALAAQESAERMKTAGGIDLDRDGLADSFEQELLTKFLPSFFISQGDCDGKPAEFKAYIVAPQTIGRNGTIYGQVFQRNLAAPGAFIEIHYYHLWGRDCGKRGHALDAEHVAALVSADRLDAPVNDWRARYWYAGAHEDTVCDVSSGARAVVLGAEDRGPKVWISSGKHASYLNYGQCTGGCGADRCQDMAPLRPPAIINIGELGTPLNGALWATSSQWPLATKFATDFDEVVLAQLTAPTTTGAVPVKPYLHPTQAVLSGADSTAVAVGSSGRSTGAFAFLAGEHTGRAAERSDRNTGAALAMAEKDTGQALGTSRKAVGISLRKAAGGVSRFIRAKAR